eukprot:2734794-Alexandrium_andersonii.AAC.1
MNWCDARCALMPDGGLLAMLRGVMRCRGWRAVQVSKLAAHQTRQQMESGTIEERHWHGNMLADMVAHQACMDFSVAREGGAWLAAAHETLDGD